MTIYETPLSEPWFSLIQLRIKKVEGRLDKDDVANMQIGDMIFFTNNDFGFQRKCMVKIKHISYYNDWQSYLETETLEKCLPGIYSIENGLRIYYNYYTPEDEREYKIKAFTF